MKVYDDISADGIVFLILHTGTKRRVLLKFINDAALTNISN